jgi:hypothetical protein
VIQAAGVLLLGLLPLPGREHPWRRLNLYDSHTEDFVRLQHRPGDPRTLADSEVFSLCDDGKGSLGIATSRGLDRLDISSEHFRPK